MTASEMEIRVILENMIDVVVILDRDGVFRAVSPSARWTLGYEPSAMVGTVSFDYVFPNDLERVLQTFRRTLETDRQMERFRFRHADGRFIWLETVARAVRREEGFRGIVVSARDITDRKAAEAKLLRSEMQYRLLVENTMDYVARFHLDGTILFVSDAVESVLGYLPMEITGVSFLDLVNPDDRTAAGNVFLGVLEEEKQGGLECRLRTKDGRYRWVETRGRVFRNEVTGRMEIFSVARDITVQKNAEEELRNTLNHLEELVHERTAELKEANTALRVLLDRSKGDRKILEERLQRNVNELLMPTLDGLRTCGLNGKGILFLDLLQSNLRDITSPFLSRLTSFYKNLTPREIQVAGMIREGKRTKEIAEILGVSTVTVDSHRINIRTKLGLTGEKVNLRSHLLSMT